MRADLAAAVGWFNALDRVRAHQLVLAAYSQPEAAGLILRGIRGIFVAIGSVIAAIICAAVAAMKGRNPLGWGILGLFFSILTLIVVIVIPSKKN